MKKPLFFAIVGFFVAVCLSASAGAAEVTIVNPGFEDSVLGDGVYNYQHPGWGYFANGGEQGSWNPGLPGTSDPGYGGNAPEGQNVGWANPGGVGVPGGFAQVLTDTDATLQAGRTYTLTVEVGNTLSWPWGGYKVQLLAGGTPGDTGEITVGTLLAEDNNLLTIAEDTFETSTVTYTYDPAHAGLLGEPLQIRLLSLGNVIAGDYTEADFDNVILTADDPTAPDVYAGDDMITWSGEPVTMDPNVVNNDSNEPQGTLTYLWTAEPKGIGDPNLDVAITDADQEDPNASVTITKTAPTGDATVVTMTLAVTLPGKDPVKDTMTIDVYDDACLAAEAVGTLVIDPTDLDGNCITNFEDFALMAITWLDDYTLTGPVAK